MRAHSANSTPLIFLDVDGVLNFIVDDPAKRLLLDPARLEPEPLRALQTICNSTSADVVISSDWRRDTQLSAKLAEELERLGINIVGATPQRSINQELRPVEIREWLAAHGGGDRSWIAIDDRELPSETGGAFVAPLNFVQIDPRVGLTIAMAEIAIAQLRLQHRRRRLGLDSSSLSAASHCQPWVWVDVDGTSETGEPIDRSARDANRLLPPLGRPFQYNAPLFHALVHSEAVRCERLLLFTQYNAEGAANTSHPLRSELVEFLQAGGGCGDGDASSNAQFCIHVEGVATVLDPVYNKGIGGYYRDVIERVERAARASEASGGSCAVEGGRLSGDALITLGTGEEEVTFDEVLVREAALYEAFERKFGGKAPDKGRLATYCLRHLLQRPPYDNVLLFLDDNLAYLEQVEHACTLVGVPCCNVHVRTEKMVDEQAYTVAIREAIKRGRGEEEEGRSRRSCVVA